MKKELQVLGIFNEDGLFEATHLVITEDIANHDLNKHLELNSNCFLSFNSVSCTEEQPSDTELGYYSCVGGRWIYIPFG